MSMKDEVLELKKELEEVREESFAMELLKDFKMQNKRLFIIWMITFLTLIGVACYTIYLLNDIESVTTEEIIEVEQDSGNNGNNNFINGNENEVNN